MDKSVEEFYEALVKGGDKKWDHRAPLDKILAGRGWGVLDAGNFKTEHQHPDLPHDPIQTHSTGDWTHGIRAGRSLTSLEQHLDEIHAVKKSLVILMDNGGSMIKARRTKTEHQLRFSSVQPLPTEAHRFLLHADGKCKTCGLPESMGRHPAKEGGDAKQVLADNFNAAKKSLVILKHVAVLPMSSAAAGAVEGHRSDEHLHQTLTEGGFHDRGRAPHIISGAEGRLYQSAKEPNHFVHTTDDGKWSSFNTDGKTHTLRHEGAGSTGLGLHIAGVLKDYTPEHPKKSEETAVFLVIRKSEAVTGKTSSGKRIQDPNHPIYRTAEKVQGFSGKVSPIAAQSGSGNHGAKMLQGRVGYSRQDHVEAAAHHRAHEAFHNEEWGKHQRAAHMEKYGTEPQVTDYKVSGVGRDEYSEHHKDALRTHSHAATAHAGAADLHEAAQRLRGLPEHEPVAATAKRFMAANPKIDPSNLPKSSDFGDIEKGASAEAADWKGVEARGWKADGKRYTHPDYPGHTINKMGGGKFFQHEHDGKAVASGNVIGGSVKGHGGGLKGHLEAFHAAAKPEAKPEAKPHVLGTNPTVVTGRFGTEKAVLVGDIEKAGLDTSPDARVLASKRGWKGEINAMTHDDYPGHTLTIGRQGYSHTGPGDKVVNQDLHDKIGAHLDTLHAVKKSEPLYDVRKSSGWFAPRVLGLRPTGDIEKANKEAQAETTAARQKFPHFDKIHSTLTGAGYSHQGSGPSGASTLYGKGPHSFAVEHQDGGAKGRHAWRYQNANGHEGEGYGHAELKQHLGRVAAGEFRRGPERDQ